MASETFNIRLYFAILLASIVGFAAIVIATVQSSISKSTISQEGLSVQLAVNNVCSSLFKVTQASISAVTDPSYDIRILTALRYT